MDDHDATPKTFPAVFTMHTPQGPTHACVRHARMVENLFRFMGAHVNATKAPEDAQCANCINDARPRDGRPQSV